MVTILSQGTSNSSVRGEGRRSNVLHRCQPLIWCREAGSMWRNRGLYHVQRSML